VDTTMHIIITYTIKAIQNLYLILVSSKQWII